MWMQLQGEFLSAWNLCKLEGNTLGSPWAQNVCCRLSAVLGNMQMYFLFHVFLFFNKMHAKYAQSVHAIYLLLSEGYQGRDGVGEALLNWIDMHANTYISRAARSMNAKALKFRPIVYFVCNFLLFYLCAYLAHYLFMHFQTPGRWLMSAWKRGQVFC